MTHRYTGPLGKAFTGDKQRAMDLQGLARLLVQELIDKIKAPPFNGTGQQTREKRLPDGTTIGAWVQMIGNAPIIRTWIDVPVVGEAAQAIAQEQMLALEGGFIFVPEDSGTEMEDAFLGLYGYAPSVGGRVLWKEAKPLKTPVIEFNTEKQAGPVSWFGRVGSKVSVLSWDHGLPCRYRLNTSEDMDCSGRILGVDILGDYYWAQSGKRDLFLDGVKIDTSYGVVGAGVFKNHIIYVAHVDLSWTSDPELTEKQNIFARQNAYSKCATFFKKAVDASGWSVIGTVQRSNAYKAPWFFSPFGNKAVTVVEWGSLSTEVVEVEISVSDSGAWSLAETTEPYESNPVTCDLGTYISREENIPEPGVDEFGFEYITRGEWMAECEYDITGTYALSSLEGKISTLAQSLLKHPFVHESSWRPGLATYIEQVTSCSGFSSEVRAQDTCSSRDSHVSYALVWTYNYTRWDGAVKYTAKRDINYKQSGPTNIRYYDSEIKGNRLAAVDYGFDGVKKYVEQKLKTNKAEYRQTNKYDVYRTVTHNPDFSERLDEQKQTYEWDIDTEWTLEINGNPLITLFGGIKNGNGVGGSYKRTLITKKTNNFDNGDCQIITERAWVYDVDARTNSVIYGKARVEASPATPVVGSFEDYGLVGVSDVVDAENESRVDSLVCIHNGIEVATVSKVAPVNSYIELVKGIAPLNVVPRMFSFNESFETIPNSAVTGNGWNQLEQLRCWRDDYIQRRDGFLCVRDPVNMIASFGFAEHDVLNAASIYNTTFNIRDFVAQQAENQMNTPLNTASLQLPPIRAV